MGETAEPYCDVMDMPKAFCSHCRGLDEPVTKPPKDLTRTGPVIEAKYEGRCACCGESWSPGEKITGTPSGWVLADHAEER